MSYEMRVDQELLLQMLDHESSIVRIGKSYHPLTRKVAAELTGYAIQTISDYATGKYNIPVDFWRRLFAVTLDLRIPRLIFGNVEFELVVPYEPPCTDRAFFKKAVEESGAYHRAQEQIAELLADGRIDELDRQSVQRYDDAYMHHRKLAAQLHRGIVHAYDKAISEVH